MSDGETVVCGFADEATDLAALVWEISGERGALLARGGEISSPEASIDPEDDRVRIRLEARGLSYEVELSPRPGEYGLSTAEGEGVAGDPSSAICEARVRISGDGAQRAINCLGHLTRWHTNPADGAELVRHLAIPGPAGSLLVLAARREAGGENHDSERVLAWQLDPEGPARPFGEALLSTQYDEAGLQSRAGLELWPSQGEAPPLRAAGTVQEGQIVNGERVTAALLHSSAEGTSGLGSYLIWRS